MSPCRPLRLLICAWLAWGCLLVGGAGRARAGTVEARSYDLPRGAARHTLPAFSRASGIEILYRVEHLRGVSTHPVRGRLPAPEALALLLQGTGLEAVRDEGSGAFVIRRTSAGAERAPRPSRLAAAVSSRAQAAAGGLVPDVVELSPFEVRSGLDDGYRAAHAVSATRMAVPIGRVPVKVSTFTEAFIADQHAYDLYDIVKWEPGVHQDNVSPQGWIRYNVRGFTAAGVQRNGFGSFRFIDTTNIERVEVVKGPASLLYGQINPGGVINYITKRPEAEQRTRLTAATGTRGYGRMVFDTTGPTPGTGGRLLYRAILMHEELPSFQDRASGRKRMLAPSLTWRLAEAATLTLDYERFERHDVVPTGGVVMRYVDGVVQRPYEPLPKGFSYAGDGDYQNFVSGVFTADLNVRIGPQTNLRALYAKSSWDMQWRATGQGGTGLLKPEFIDAFYPPAAGLTPADAMFRRNRWERQWGGRRTGQVDLVHQLDAGFGQARLLVGAKRDLGPHQRSQQRNNPNVASSPFYLRPWDLRDPSTWDRSVPFGPEVLLPAVDLQSASDATAWYGIVSLTAWQDRLHLLGGFSRHQVHNAPTVNRVAGTSVPPSDRQASVPQVGASWLMGEGFSWFATYSESFLANQSMLLVDNVPTTPARPSLGRGLEAGFKFDLLDGRLTGSLSGFRITADPSDIVSRTSGVAPDGTTLFTDVQGGTQLSQGFDLNVSHEPLTGLHLMLGVGFADAVYRRHPIRPEYDGTPLVAAPDRTFSLWGRYAPRAGPMRHITVAGGVIHVGRRSHASNNPAAQLAPYTTVDFGLGVRGELGGWPVEAEVRVKNLFDERYYESATSWGFPRRLIFSVRTEF